MSHKGPTHHQETPFHESKGFHTDHETGTSSALKHIESVESAPMQTSSGNDTSMPSPLTTIVTGGTTTVTNVKMSLSPTYLSDLFITQNISEVGNGGNSVTLGPAVHNFNRIEVLIGKSDTPAQIFYPDIMLLLMNFYVQGQFLIMGKVMNVGSTWGTGTLIATTASYIYKIPLLGFLLSTSEQLHTSLLNAEESGIVFRCVFTTATNVNAGSGTPSLNSVGQITEGVRTPSIHHKFHEDSLKELSRGGHWGKYLDTSYIVGGSISTVGGTAVSIKLTSAPGHVSAIFIFPRATKNGTASGGYSNWMNCADIGDSAIIQIRDNQNATYLGQNGMTLSDLRMKSVKHFQGSYFNYVNVIPIIFAHDFHESLLEGVEKGFHVIGNNDDYLDITPASSFATTTLNWDVYVLRFKMIHHDHARKTLTSHLSPISQ